MKINFDKLKNSLFRVGEKTNKLLLLLNQLSFQAFTDSFRLRINKKIQQNLDKNLEKRLKLRVTDIWSNRGRSVRISWKLIAVPKIIQSQDYKITFKLNLTCMKKTQKQFSFIHFVVDDPVVDVLPCAFYFVSWIRLHSGLSASLSEQSIPWKSSKAASTSTSFNVT